jgi:PST family polysaccharide transporter
VAYNLDKLLIGRVWGPGALGIYGTAYQLANAPTRDAMGAIGMVAFAALARVQAEPARLKSYFLRGFALVVSATMPITLFAAVFADDIVLLLLGPKWAQAATVYRLLAPAILVFSIINPTGWLLQSVGLQGRSLRIGCAIAPLVVTGFVLGLPYGPAGVALGFSVAMTLWLVPHVFWCLHGTVIRPHEILTAALPPFAASVAAAGLAFGVAELWLGQLPALARLALAGMAMGGAYLAVLMLAMDQKDFYWGLLRDIRGASPSGSVAP